MNRNIQHDPVGIFQEIVQNAAQSNRNNVTQAPKKCTSTEPISAKMDPDKDNHLPKNPGSSGRKFEPIRFDPIPSELTFNKLIKIEDVKFEPITIEHVPVIPQYSAVHQVFVYNDQQMPIPYFPQIKYETTVNVTSNSNSFYVQYPVERINADNNVNPVQVRRPQNYSNFKASGADVKKAKKRFQDKRKNIKKARKSKNSKVRVVNKTHNISSADSDENPLEKRSIHNSMERQRRIGLKNLFIELKQAIPTLSERERVPKVNILREAIDFCHKIRNDEKLLEDLKKKNLKLLTHYHRLYKDIMMN